MFKRFLPLIFLLTGCAPTTQLSKPINFDYDKVEDIEFKLDSLPDNKSGISDSEWTKAVSIEISQRFANAGFPITNSLDNAKQSSTHILNAKVDEARITDTQPGVTIGFGNSDPRSANFQKTLSAPINCTIQSLKDPDQNISLKELKSIASPFDNIGLSQQQKNEKLKRFYVENIGSTCHNLLKKLSVKRTSAPKSDAIDDAIDIEAFMPAIRIETKYKTDKNQNLNVGNTDKSDDAASKASSGKDENTDKSDDTASNASSGNDGNTDKSDDAASNTSSGADYFPNITTEEKNTQDWRDAEITIFNQGDTLILEFGNNRR